jgi:MinD superfamily P-loop ATPase
MKSHIPRSTAVSKIAVCGKGGSGKTTTVALLALALKSNGRRVIVVDADESNPAWAGCWESEPCRRRCMIYLKKMGSSRNASGFL